MTENIKKIKIKDLAKKLNLSISSISRALNGHKNISTFDAQTGVREKNCDEISEK